jgi:D-arabinose 1-dehydrogenase-like Zn-dependent alcohol dehydrogenase
MPKMRVVQVPKAKAAFEIVEREIPAPPAGWVRIRVQACGVCHSDSVTKEGLLPGIEYPRVPGHEVAGVIDALGANVAEWKVGQAVGVGWNGGYCGHCEPCRRGEFFACKNGQTTGVTYDGGYADYMIAPASALALRADGLSPVEAAPMVCAGVTTFNALRNSGARPGDVVAILGAGGLGHLGIQFASKMSFKTVAIARGKEKEPFVRKLGAWQYIDSTTQNVAEELQKLGGATAIISTVTDGPSMAATQGGLAPNGTLMLLGVDRSLEVSPTTLIFGNRSVKGWYSGTSIDSQDTLAYSAFTGVRSMNEIYPLEKAAEAYDRMQSGKARFRVVLTMEN